MNHIYRILNLDGELFEGGATYGLRFTDRWAYPILAVVVAAGLTALVVFLYRHESRRLSRLSRGVLMALRLLAVLAVFAAIFSPALVFETTTKDKSHVLVLVDSSSSMLIRDNYASADGEAVAKAVTETTGNAVTTRDVAKQDRIDIANSVASYLRDRIEENKDFDVAVYSFAEHLRAIDEGTEETRGKPLEIEASGERTELGSALSELLRTFRGQNVSAVVVLSDGCSNAGYLPSSAADLAKERRLPVYVLGIGNPRHPKDIKVANLLANDTILVNDPAEFDVDVSAWGYEGREGIPETADVVLYEQSSGSVKEIGRETVKLLSGGDRVPVHFEYTPTKPGENIYRVEVESKSDEARTDNNTESVAVSVVEAKLRVLYVSYEPSWEYRVLSRALIQDKMVHTACWLQSADPQFEQDGNDSIDKLPDSLDQLLRREKKPTNGAAASRRGGSTPPSGGSDAVKEEEKKEFIGYDVVILAGIDPSEITEKFTNALVSFVRDHGGGMMFVAGKKMTPYVLKNTRAEEFLGLLPIEIEDKHDTSNYGKRLFCDEFHLRLTAEGSDMRLTQIAKSPEESRKLWEEGLPGFYWYYPVRRAKPGATVIAVHERDRDLATASRKSRTDQRPMPVLASHFYGKGRVMFLGVDSTWRWRKDVQDRYFYKFWSQSLHYLGKGSLLKKLGGVTITTDRSTYVVGDTVTIRAKVVDEATLEPSAEESYTALIQQIGSIKEPEQVVLPATEEVGTYEYTWKAKGRGSYHIWLQMEGKKDEKPGLRKFEIQLPAREKEDLRIDEKTLASLATHEGRFYPPSRMNEITEIPELVRPVAETRVVTRTVTVWDSPAVLVALLALFIAEWIVRKQRGLT